MSLLLLSFLLAITPCLQFFPPTLSQIEVEPSCLSKDYTIISTKDGYLHLINKTFQPKKQWSISLGPPLITTNIINKLIFNEPKILIPMEGKLFVASSEMVFEEFTIPIIDLVNRTPFSLAFMSGYFFLGLSTTSMFTIDIDKGIILSNEFENYNKERNIINVFRVDYSLICNDKNNEQVWNTTVSDITIVDSGSTKEVMIQNETNNLDDLNDTAQCFENAGVTKTDIYSLHSYDKQKHMPIKIFDSSMKKFKKETLDIDYFSYDEYNRIFRCRDALPVILFGALIGVVIFFIRISKEKKANSTEHLETLSNNQKNDIIQEFFSSELTKSLTKKRMMKTKNHSWQLDNHQENFSDEDERGNEEKYTKKYRRSQRTEEEGEVNFRRPFKSFHIKRERIFSEERPTLGANIHLEHKNSEIKEIEEDTEANEEKIEIPFSQMVEQSNDKSSSQTRLERNFEDFVKISETASGCLLKARHRIDCEIYSIEIIKLSFPVEQAVVREAKIMTKIHSKHIIEYKTCWFERSLGSLSSIIFSKLNANQNMSKSKSYQKLTQHEINLIDQSHLAKIEEEDESYLANDNDVAQKIFNESFSDYEDNKLCKKKIVVDFRDDTSNYLSNQSIITKRELFPIEAYFFVQLEFCDGLPLSHYIESKKKIDRKTVFSFMHQLLKGLKKIHSNNITHRDIKPDNIFLVADLVKIGGFCLKSIIPNKNSLYLAPEQCERKNCNSKVDIYSAGLIFYELCACFHDDIERKKKLTSLKRERIVTLDNSYKNEIKLILLMTEKNPAHRPSAVEILTSKEYAEWEEEINKIK